MNPITLITIVSFFFFPFDNGFKITEGAQAFMDNHEITFVRKKNDIILFNTDNVFAYRTVVANCEKIFLKDNNLIIQYRKGQIKFAYPNDEFIRYHRKNENAPWDGYRLKRSNKVISENGFSTFMFQLDMYELQYKVLTEVEKEQILEE